ncbi:MAG TPA: LacI family DNA-binding transcriptional regulator [Phycisphaerae bacterium]|nr:LacI family DNA-binding transcriptional regulator [Phycisphaerae bacterium]
MGDESKTTSQGFRSATIYEVAKRAGVSAATVSRVLSGATKGTWKRTARRIDEIRRIAAELGYEPSWKARALARGRTGTICLLHRCESPLLISEFWQGIIAQVYSALEGVKLDVQLLFFPDALESLQANRRKLMDQRFDGCIVLERIDPDLDAVLRESAMPVVLLNGAEKGWPKVRPDDFGGAVKATEHLIALGHRRLAFLSQPIVGEGHFSFWARMEGVQHALKQAGLEPPTMFQSDPAEVVARMFSPECESRPTALVVYHTQWAIRCLQALWRRGLRVPQDVSVVTFDDVISARISIPPLTTVDVPGGQMARKATDLLLELMEKPTVAHESDVVLPERLIVRESTAVAPH